MRSTAHAECLALLAWPRIEAAVADACAGATGPLLTQLAGPEEALLSSPLSVRAARASS